MSKDSRSTCGYLLADSEIDKKNLVTKFILIHLDRYIDSFLTGSRKYTCISYFAAFDLVKSITRETLSRIYLFY